MALRSATTTGAPFAFGPIREISEKPMHPPRSRTLVLCLLSALHAMPALAATKRGAASTSAASAASAPLETTQPPAGSADVVDTRRELEQRVLDAPGDMQARLALAQLLASQPATLRSGIVQLSQLARDRSVGAEAIGSWRAALGWAGTDRNDIPLYQAYLKLRPKDAAVRQRLAEIQRGAVDAPASAPAPTSAAAMAPMAAGAAATTATTNATPSQPAPAPLTGTAYMPPAVLPSTGGAAPITLYGATGASGAAAAGGRPSTIPNVVIPDPVTPAPATGSPLRGASARDYPVGPVVRADESPAQAQLRNLRAEIADIESYRARPEFTAGLIVRSRQGEKGTSSLTDTEFPMQLRMDMGDGTLTAHVTPVVLRTGRLDTSFASISRFGGGPVVANAQPGADAGRQNQSGVGVGVGWEQGNLAVDIGTTPMGFRYTDINGGVRYRMPVNEEMSFTMNLSRRALTDSVLSFAGARDARTGQEWGGVSANGARFDGNYDSGNFGAYGYVGAARLLGHDVESNTRLEYGTGVFYRLIRRTDESLTAGLSLTGLAYDKNLSYYTFGHGGYFSPKQFVSVGIPVDWQQRTGRMSYQLKGSLGVQHVRQDPVAYFPGDPVQQAAAGTTYAGVSKTGLGYNLAAAAEYQVEPQWFLGGRLGIDNSRDYRQYIGSVYLRYAFRPYEGPQVMPVNPIRSPYGS